MLEFHNVGASYGGLVALTGISLQFNDGERVAVFGHNGAGKTTLLRCAVGSQQTMTGEVRFRGERIVPGQVFRNVRRGIGFVPQGANVFRELSVEQNLGIAGLLHDRRAVGEVYDLFPMLNERRRQIASSLSGGQQQMLALGMALMTNPSILLLDEPTTGLAPIIANNVLRGLQTINQTKGTAIVIVEQNVSATLKAVDRAVILKSGSVVFEGSAEQLSAEPNLWAWF
ncbi:MAG TPA: ABC transporter ATP-binding protein [Acetobacteraceae bacterium]|nr:ABC transporter ATP-binding protein [Acetobacteraceae bacterium]